MKKYIAVVLALVFVLTFVSCSRGENIPPEENISAPVLEGSEQSEESVTEKSEHNEEIEEPVSEEKPQIKPLPEIEGEPLSEEEIEFFNELFRPMLNDVTEDLETNPLSHFFMSYYDNVREMSFPMFVYYFPCDGRHVDEEEFQKLRKVEAWGFENCKTLEDMVVPVHSISKKEVDTVLMEYAGITSDDLDTSAVAYLEEYDCYYTSTSDYGPGTFVCTKGIRDGNTIYLYEEEEPFYIAMEYGEGMDMLVLQEDEGTYKIISHQRYKNS
ncbi:MAG: hypothetical protein J6J07_09640 [Oscillospiraceae bacterium]|nr:hypothetical protein [Oscillospiraceae bacterium]